MDGSGNYHKPSSVFFFFIFLLFSLDVPHGFALDLGDSIPAFELKQLDGDIFRTEEFRNKSPVFLLFWATWCPVCKEEIPKVNSIYKEFKAKGMAFLAVDVGINDSVMNMKRFINQFRIAYPAAFDEGSKITRLYGVVGTSTVFIIDRKGIVRYKAAVVPYDLSDHFEELVR